MTLSARVVNTIQTTETLAGLPAVVNKSVTTSAYSPSSREFTATTVPPVSKAAYPQHTQAASADTIDLTAIPSGLQGTVDGTGLKVQLFRLYNTSTNTGTVTIEAGASNGYLLFGTAGKVIVPIGGRITFEGYDSLPDVAAAAKNLTLTGTATDVYDIEIILG